MATRVAFFWPVLDDGDLVVLAGRTQHKPQAQAVQNTQPLDPTRRQTMQLLRTAPRTIREAAKALGITDNSAQSRLDRLCTHGLVRRATRQRGSLYHITTEGLDLLRRADRRCELGAATTYQES